MGQRNVFSAIPRSPGSTMSSTFQEWEGGVVMVGVGMGLFFSAAGDIPELLRVLD